MFSGRNQRQIVAVIAELQYLMDKSFAENLLLWNRESNDREMPWKGEKDPYRIWLSEIILQQTRVDQGLAYYHRFIERFPTIFDLARAPETSVFRLWQGLGYYSRCKNLIETARTVVNSYNGVFPGSYKDIRGLKGIGPYTAAAIASFAFNLPHAVVDGNVERVIARFFGNFMPVDTSEGKKLYAELATRLLDKENPGIYNQAIMDFGAMICKPRLPLCDICVFREDCQAFIQDKIGMLPIKQKKLSSKTRWFCYFIVEVDDKIYISQRTGKDIWQNLYEFILKETLSELSIDEILIELKKSSIFASQAFEVRTISALFQQQLTHQLIKTRFIHIGH